MFFPRETAHLSVKNCDIEYRLEILHTDARLMKYHIGTYLFRFLTVTQM